MRFRSATVVRGLATLTRGRRVTGLLTVVASLMSAGLASAEDEAMAPGRELLRDPGFRHGLAVLAAKGAGEEVGVLRPFGAASTPVWQLAQWHSRFPWGNHEATDAHGLVVSNAAKWLRLDPRSAGGTVVTLGVDSRPEYDDRPRASASEPWVHLLVQQSVVDAPSLAERGAWRLRFETRLVEARTFRPPGYSADRHAAQFQVVLTLNNLRRGSPGYGDYLWFVVPVYDDRHDVPPPHVARDFAVARGKLIYNPGAAALATNVVEAGGWRRFDADLKPWFERALGVAWEKGYLRDSRDPSDYRVAHLNVGWEVPGLNRVAMELRGLSLEVRR